MIHSDTPKKPLRKAYLSGEYKIGSQTKKAATRLPLLYEEDVAYTEATVSIPVTYRNTVDYE